jgi:hypothetical protein
MAQTQAFETKGKIGKAWRSDMRRGGAHCDACGVDCGGWHELLAHLRKESKHPGRVNTLSEQRERVEEVVTSLTRSAIRRAA